MTAEPNISTTFSDPNKPKPPTPDPMMDNTNNQNDPNADPLFILFNNSSILSTSYPNDEKHPTPGPMMDNSKDFYSTLFDHIDPNASKPPTPDPMIDSSKDPNEAPPPKGSKGPPMNNYPDRGQEEMGEPAIHSEMLQYKESLGIISMIFIATLMIFALLQIKIDTNCYANFKKGQLGNISGKTLFILFIIALIMSVVNVVVFIHFIFNIHTISPSLYAYDLIFCMIPYRISKLAMSLFFILRLHFVFKDTAFRMNKYTLYTLIGLSIIGTFLGCVSGIVGPLHLIHWNPDEDKGINPALLFSFISLGIAILVDIVVIFYYNQRLRAIVIMQGEVSERKSVSRRKTYSTVATKTVSLETRHAATIELQTKDNIQTDGKRASGTTPMYEEDGIDGDGEWEEFEVIETEVYVDKELVRTITKSTLLSLIGILTSFWLHIEMLVKAIYGESDGVLFRAIASFDGGVNVICMYLIFAFSRPYYDIGCIACHFVMSKCCTIATKRAVIREKNVTHSEV